MKRDLQHNWSGNRILYELRNYRETCAKRRIIQSKIQNAEEKGNKLFKTLNADHEIYDISAWLELLTIEERFIVQTHLINGLDWARTNVEYEQKWGIVNGRSERTLKRIQSKAILRIANFLNNLENIIKEQTQ